MKLVLILIGLILDLAWAILGTIALGLVCMAICNLLFSFLPRQLLSSAKKARNRFSGFFAPGRQSACQSI